MSYFWINYEPCIAQRSESVIEKCMWYLAAFNAVDSQSHDILAIDIKSPKTGHAAQR